MQEIMLTPMQYTLNVEQASDTKRMQTIVTNTSKTNHVNFYKLEQPLNPKP
jgi:dethiobiotin synthetase